MAQSQTHGVFINQWTAVNHLWHAVLTTDFYIRSAAKKNTVLTVIIFAETSLAY
jgi:hypothetical protein